MRMPKAFCQDMSPKNLHMLTVITSSRCQSRPRATKIGVPSCQRLAREQELGGAGTKSAMRGAGAIRAPAPLFGDDEHETTSRTQQRRVGGGGIDARSVPGHDKRRRGAAGE